MTIPNHADALSGTWNFRDIGGIPTPVGPVRRGIVFRSAVLSQLDPAGLCRAGEARRHRCFRPPRTAGDRPGRGRSGAGDGDASRLRRSIRRRTRRRCTRCRRTAAPRTQDDGCRAYYAAIPTLAPAQQSVATILRTVADGSGGVLVHCAAGKDRTGWTIATLLTAVGADRDAVLADYLLSNAAIESLRVWMQAQYGDAFLAEDGVLGVDRAICRPPGIRSSRTSARSTAIWTPSGSTTVSCSGCVGA